MVACLFLSCYYEITKLETLPKALPETKPKAGYPDGGACRVSVKRAPEVHFRRTLNNII